MSAPDEAAGRWLLHRRVELIAARSGSATAVVSDTDSCDYGTLLRRASQLANYLRGHGIGAGDVVLVRLEKSVDVVVAAVAAWQLGAAYAPMDHRTPAARVGQVLDQLPVAVALVTTASLDPAVSGPAITVMLDRDGGRVSAQSADPPRPAGESPDNLAYLGQTSGSTGTPKLVGISHRSLTSCYDGWATALDLEGRIRSHLQVAGLAFDVHVGDVCRSLLSGARLVLCPAEAAVDPARLHALLHDERIDAVLLTPSVLRLLLPWLERNGHTLARLRQFAVGGENWTAEEYRRLRRLAGPHTRILNFYGLAEACVDSLYCDLASHPPGPDGIPLGQPFPGVGAFVLDRDLRPTPVGEVGELFLSGPGLAAGYYGSPSDTAERFLVYPDGAAGARRLFRTGDLVRRLPGDVLVYHGREDDQVKVRGARVQLSEVEATLARCPGVESAAAALRDRAGEPILVGYLIPAGEQAGLATAARDYVAGLLPTAMVPSAIVLCPSFPLTMSGKVDRRGLPEPGSGSLGQPAGRWTTATQEAVARHWTRLLGRPPTSATDDFFHAGASSLSAARLALDLAAELGRDVPPGAVFASPTVGGLARTIDGLGGQRPPGTANAGLTSAPVTAAQRRLWLLHRLHPGNAAYHVPVLAELRGPLRIASLRESLDLLARRHDSLRTVFTRGPAGLVAQLREPGRLPLEQLELPAPDRLGRLAVAERALHRWTAAPFDVASGPLVRAVLCRLDDDHHLLLMVAHHLVLDGWSVGVLLEDLGRVYSALVAGRPVPPPLAPVRMVDVAARLSASGEAAAARAALRYWRRQLADPPPPIRLPRAAPRAAGAPAAARHRRLVAPQTVAAVRGLARAHRATTAAVLLAATAALLHRWTCQEDLVIGAPVGHRDHADTEHVVGMLVSTHALRIAAATEMPFDDLVARARHAIVGALTHRAAPYETIVHELGLSGGPPLFRVWLNMLGPQHQPPAMAGLRTTVADPPLPGALFDLCLYITEDPGRLQLELVHSTDAIDPGCAAEFLEQLGALLAAACAAPAVPIGEHRLETASGAEVLPRPKDDLRASAQAAPALLGRLQATASANAGLTAVYGPDGSRLSYAKLYRAASAIAARLRLAGIGDGAVVPILAQRRPELAAALIGVLAAGASFAVIGLDQPVRRIAAMIGALAPRAGISLAEEVPGELEPLCGQWVDVGGPAPSAAGLDPVAEARPGYVAFTSGTTGRPRAVHSGTEPLAHFLSWYVAKFGITAGDRFCMLSGLGYDPLLRDILTPLWVGGTLWTPPAAALRDPRALLTWLAASKVSVAHLTPQLARLLSLAPEELSAPDLRLLCIGGDTLYGEDVRAVTRWAPGARIVNVYGATETPQIVAYQPVAGPGAVTPGLPVPIGTAAPGSQLLIMRGQGPAGVCEIGRVIVRGPHLAAGYLGGADGFQPDEPAGHRRFDTGDLGRYLPDGTVELVGRAGDRLKVRGFRVDLAEILGCLRGHPAVRDCAVAPRRGPDGEQQLVCYVVANPGRASPADIESIKRRLRAYLPEPMLPAEVRLVPVIPLTVTGKPDRAALAASEPAAPPVPAAAQPAPGPGPGPRELEDLVAEAWREVAGAAPHDHQRNFFDLGGSSMLMVSLHAVLERRLAVEVPMTALFEYPTVRELAAYLSNRGHPDPERPAAATAQPNHDLRARRLAARRAAQFPRP